MRIRIFRPDEGFLARKGIKAWPVWQKEASSFQWNYEETEECYVLEGRVVVQSEDGSRVVINPGDFVTFPKGLSCVWEVQSPLRKHYNFPGN